MKILLIEDDETLRNCIGHYLVRDGHTVHEYTRGEGAVEYALKMRPDLVLTDHNLTPGGVLGLEIAGELQREGQRVVLMSGDPTVEGFATLAGVQFIEKSDLKEIVREISSHAK